MLTQSAVGFVLEKYPARNAAKQKHKDGAEVEFCATDNRRDKEENRHS